MKILGIHDGHTATACYLEDGKIISALSEERLTRKKGHGGFPSAALRHILEQENLSPDDIDIVALVGFLKPLTSTDQYQEGRQKYFPKLIRMFPGDPGRIINFVVSRGKKHRLRDNNLVRCLQDAGLPLHKVRLVEHHQAHAATAWYLSPFYQQGQPALVITLDGSGDGLSGTVSLVDAQGKWSRLQNISSFDSPGMVYSRVTQYLAMKPWEHEFKLMGMAPYASPEYAEKVFRILHGYLRLSDNGLSFENQKKLWGNSLLDRFRHDFRNHRFDAVAAGVQLFHERLLVPFIHNWIQKTGVPRVAVAGGCFMNIKANKLLMELDSVEDIFIMPSCGDDSCAIGAALWEDSMRPDRKDSYGIAPLRGLYWGPEFTDRHILETLRLYADSVEYRQSENIEKESAELLAHHKIIGRFSGRMQSLGVMLMADESVCSPEDLERIIENGYYKMVNVRLSKCGGFRKALQMIGQLRTQALSFQIGCQLGESGILSAAGRALSLLCCDAAYYDGSYDRFMLQKNTTVEDVSFGLGGKAGPLAGPGIGVQVDRENLRHLSSGFPCVTMANPLS